MSIFKCKMCGGTLEINQGESVAVCEYCGTRQTLPRLDDERRANLYDRANHFRRNNEYDRATGIYEQILNEDSTDAEAYWSLVLCRYGIEYVEDPTSRKRLPTVNRMQFTSVFDDENYRLALQYADGEQRAVYEEEANAINELQKGILAISEKEDPFDVFICYKETDANGRRTQDAVLANDLYHQLTQEGFKAFFARITLEDKLGTAYEPYIFAALNSAKVMVVLGTKAEHFNAVWVRNEWSRYLALIKGGDNKTLIPAYRDMDPYDLPEEFSHLQAQDMSKLGFMQDLIRGIGKILQADKPRTVVREVPAPSSGGSTEGLLKRAYLYLEDGDWTNADQYCEKVLDQDPENAMGYVGKLMTELHVHRREELADCEQSFEENGNYRKALRFADDKLAGELKGYIAHIVERNENTRLETIYTDACNLINNTRLPKDFEKAAEMFESIKEYKDSAALMEKSYEKGEACRKNNIYTEAFNLMNSAYMQEDCEKAARMFESIQEYKDSAELIEKCYEKGKVCKEKAEERRKATKQKTRKKVLCMFAIAAVVGIFIGGMELIYTRAQNYRRDGQYEKAYRLYSVLLGYKDSDAYAEGCLDSYGWNLIEEGKYEEALKVFNKLYRKAQWEAQWDYQLEKYSRGIAAAENRIRAATARALVDEGKYEEALAVYENEVNGYVEEEENCRIAVK